MNRVFTARDPAAIFRRFLDKQSHKLERETRSESHEWFNSINLKQLWGNKDILLSDNTLRVRAILDVEVEDTPVRSSKSQSQNCPQSAIGIGKTKSTRTEKTHISEHSIFNEQMIQYSNHSPFGSETFRSHRPHTTRNWSSRDHRQKENSNVSFKPNLRRPQSPQPSCSIGRPSTINLHDGQLISSDQPRLPSSHQPNIYENHPSITSYSILQINNFTPVSDSVCNLAVTLKSRAATEYHMSKSSRSKPQTAHQNESRLKQPEKTIVPKLEYKSDEDIHSGSNVIPIARPRTSKNVEKDVSRRTDVSKHPELLRHQSVRPEVRPPLQADERPNLENENSKKLNISNTDCAIICGNKKFNVHSVILKGKNYVILDLSFLELLTYCIIKTEFRVQPNLCFCIRRSHSKFRAGFSQILRTGHNDRKCGARSYEENVGLCIQWTT